MARLTISQFTGHPHPDADETRMAQCLAMQAIAQNLRNRGAPRALWLPWSKHAAELGAWPDPPKAG